MPEAFHFGNRQIVRMGYSRMVALPKDWLRNAGIVDRGEVSVSMDAGGNLVLSAIGSPGGVAE